jgi:hypothetical protein
VPRDSLAIVRLTLPAAPFKDNIWVLGARPEMPEVAGRALLSEPP